MKTKNSIRSMEKADKFRNQMIYDPRTFQYSNFAVGQFNNAVNGGGAPVTVSRLSQAEATMVLVIANSAAAAVTVTLFNVNGLAPSAANSGLTPTFQDGVTVTCPQGSYGAILISLISKVYKIGGLKYSCQNKIQLTNQFITGWRNEFGTFGGGTYTPRYLGNNMQNVQTEIDDPTFEMDVNVSAYIQLTVNGSTLTGGSGENVELVFTIASVIDNTRQLNGQPAQAINGIGQQSGIPAQNLIVSNTPVGGGGINLAGGGVQGTPQNPVSKNFGW